MGTKMTVNDRKPNEPTVCPDEGKSGKFTMIMYRGQKKDRLNKQFASDPGDYGRGIYWAGSREFASIYGEEIIEQEVSLENALRLSSDDILKLARESGATIMENGHEARLAAAEKVTRDMIADGYDGIVTFGYETFEMWSACVFSKDGGGAEK